MTAVDIKKQNYVCHSGSCIAVLVILCFLFSMGHIRAQTLVLSQSISIQDANPDTPFDYVISVSCNSTTTNCHNTVVSGYLPTELDFLNFSDPLPAGIATATYDPWSRYYEFTFDEANPNALAQGSTVQFAIQALFPGGTVEGSTATHTVQATSTNASNASATNNTTVSNAGYIVSPRTFPDDKKTDPDQVAGAYQFYQIQFGNVEFQAIDNYQIIDVIPNDVTFDQVSTPELPFLNQAGQLYYMRSDQPGTWFLWENFNINTRITRLVSDLSLPAGVKVTQIRTDFGNIPEDARYNPYRYQSEYNTSLIIFVSIPNGLPDGYSYTNCADYYGTVGGSNRYEQDCATTTIITPPPVDRVTGILYWHDLNEDLINIATIGDTILARNVFFGEPLMTQDILGGVMSVVLPPGLTYVPGSEYEAFVCNSFDGQEPVIELDVTFDGRQIVRFVYDVSYGNDFILEPSGDWDGCGFFFRVVIGPSAIEGNNIADYYFNATGSTHADCNTPDVDNYLNGYSADFCQYQNDINIARSPSSAGVRAEKFVTGTKDAGVYSQYPATATTVPGGLSNYRIVLTNPNATPINNIEIIDILPYVGDTDILNEATPRFSQWQPNLAEPITTPAGITTYYTTANNPCRDELAGANPTPFPSGCNNPSWTTVPPADITDVTALKFDLTGITLNQNDNVTIEYEMRAPVNAPIGGEVAWNSFAYVAEIASSGSPLLPTEAIKVGIQTTAGTVPIVGDFVWDDLNGNGLQDVGEPGIDGVRVALIQDTNGNGRLGGGDQEYTWTITANGGQYIFSDFPAGDYFVEFTNFPSGHVATHRDVGPDDGINSDGPITDALTFGSSTDRNDIDFGLYSGGALPSLWSCAGNILSNPEYESGFASWVNLGNSSLTSDAYVNSRAMLISGGQGGRQQVLNVSPGETYQLSFYAKKTGSEDVSGGFNVQDANNNPIHSLSRAVYDNIYEYHVVTLTMPANAIQLEVFGSKNAGSGAAYFDAFCLTRINDICGAGSQANNDGDSVCDRYDIDDDNDGIRDIDESACTPTVTELGGWSHNNSDSIAGDNRTNYVDSFADEVYGSGLAASVVNTGLRFWGLDAVDLADAIVKNDYIEYAITTSDSINSIYLDHFDYGKWTDGAPTFDAVPDNFGYDFTVLISTDGFATSSVIADIHTVDNNVNPIFANYDLEVDDNYYPLAPATTYGFRIYFYNKTTDPNTQAYFDDFAIFVRECRIALDTDSDSYGNHLDLDSDNDGLTDLIESGHTATDANLDGIIDDALLQSGINGFYNGLESPDDIGIRNYVISDSESSPDGIYDPYEVDSDGDGCFDSIESEISNLDPDKDGIAGTGAPTTSSNGLVNGTTYTTPLSNYWQDALYNYCQSCRTALTNPHIMYYRRNK